MQNKLNNKTPTESKDYWKILKTIKKKNDRNKNDEDVTIVLKDNI
jgi:hypothetical protein